MRFPIAFTLSQLSVLVCVEDRVCLYVCVSVCLCVCVLASHSLHINRCEKRISSDFYQLLASLFLHYAHAVFFSFHLPPLLFCSPFWAHYLCIMPVGTFANNSSQIALEHGHVLQLSSAKLLRVLQNDIDAIWLSESEVK